MWATHRLYNELAPLYDLAAWLVSEGHWAEWRRIALEYVAGERVLEVGFGTGELLTELAQRGGSVCGLEPSWAMQRVTARKLRRRRLSPPRVLGAAQALPFADGCMDTIVSTFPAEYIANAQALGEIHRVLRGPRHRGDSGGRLVIVGLAVYKVDTRPGNRFRTRSGDPGLERFCERLSAAGLTPHLISRYAGATRLLVIVAERSW